jgi:hypothetical protein
MVSFYKVFAFKRARTNGRYSPCLRLLQLADEAAKEACKDFGEILALRMDTVEEFEALEEDDQLNVFKDE